MIQKKCLFCNNEFTPNKHAHHQKFCERNCLRGYERKVLRANKEKHDKFKIKNRILYRKKRKINNLSEDRLTNLPGKGHKRKDGYIIMQLKSPYTTTKYNTIFEHVLIMSRYLERPLIKGETVHHKNGMRNDNRIENLELWNTSQPPGQRVEDKINWAKEFLHQYGYKIIK